MFVNEKSFYVINRDKLKNKKIVKASFKGCSLQDRKIFFKSKCLLPISVGQKVHEKDKFAATIDLINRSFRECTILIDDTIQRHTLRIEDDRSDLELYEESLRLADEWLGRNSYIINQLIIPHEVIRWDKWLHHKNYAAQRKIIQESYSKNTEFKEAIDSNVKTFLSRYKVKEGNYINYDKAVEYCLEYLKEECTCMCLWPLEGYHFEVYPSGRNEAMAKTYELLIEPSTPNLLKSVSLRFKKYVKSCDNSLIDMAEI